MPVVIRGIGEKEKDRKYARFLTPVFRLGSKHIPASPLKAFRPILFLYFAKTCRPEGRIMRPFLNNPTVNGGDIEASS
jgi:hypothetical protein